MRNESKDTEDVCEGGRVRRISGEGRVDGVGYSICQVGSAVGLTFRSSLPREQTIEASAFRNPGYGLLNDLLKAPPPFHPPPPAFFL